MAWVRIPPLPRSFGPAAAVAPFRGLATPGSGGQPLQSRGRKLRGQRPPPVRPPASQEWGMARRCLLLPPARPCPAACAPQVSLRLLPLLLPLFPSATGGKVQKRRCPGTKRAAGEAGGSRALPSPAVVKAHFSCVVAREARCSFSQLQGFARYNCCPLHITCKTVVVPKV